MSVIHEIRIAFLSLLLCGPLVGFAQQDTTSIGGPEDSTTYEETGAGPDIDEAMTPDLMTAADSAYIIPGYSTYGSWNTDVIFPARPAVADTVDLRLSWADCDHAMPICGRITSPFGGASSGCWRWPAGRTGQLGRLGWASLVSGGGRVGDRQSPFCSRSGSHCGRHTERCGENVPAASTTVVSSRYTL